MKSVKIVKSINSPTKLSKIKIPGKTFLVGEYVALIDGPALGLSTKPYFEAEYVLSSKPTNPYHPESLAGKAYDPSIGAIQFKDPYQGVGGFGASTAEYISVMAANNLIDPENLNSLLKIRDEYRNYSGDVVKPSGYDLLFQLQGQVTYVNITEKQIKKYYWPFDNLGFFIVSTGHKVRTHEHLAELDLVKLKELIPYAKEAVDAFFRSQEIRFLSQLKNWVNELQKRHLIVENSIQLKTQLEVHPEVLLVKPCGALGSDTLLVFYQTIHQQQVFYQIEGLGLHVQASHKELCDGILVVPQKQGDLHVG